MWVSMKIGWFGLVVLLGGFVLWVRLAPSDPGRWHVTQLPAGVDLASGLDADIAGEGSFVALRHQVPETAVERLIAAIDATARTSRLAGTFDPAQGQGMITWRTRSLIWGFPDYSTLQIERQIGAPEVYRITLYGRLRFGRSDMGVNRRRIADWLAQAGLE